MAGADSAEVEDVGEPVGRPVVEGAAQPVAGRDRAVDGQPRQRAFRVVAQRVGVRDEVQAVVAVQVRDQDRVDVQQPDVLLERPERAVADVDQQPEPSCSSDVGRARRTWARETCPRSPAQ